MVLLLFSLHLAIVCSIAGGVPTPVIAGATRLDYLTQANAQQMPRWAGTGESKALQKRLATWKQDPENALGVPPRLILTQSESSFPCSHTSSRQLSPERVELVWVAKDHTVMPVTSRLRWRGPRRVRRPSRSSRNHRGARERGK